MDALAGRPGSASAQSQGINGHCRSPSASPPSMWTVYGVVHHSKRNPAKVSRILHGRLTIV